MTLDKIDKIRKSHLALSESRGLSATYCPSEVARKVFSKETWRNHMDDVRQVADKMVDEGILVTMQKGKIIEELPTEARGPIRLRKSK